MGFTHRRSSGALVRGKLVPGTYAAGGLRSQEVALMDYQMVIFRFCSTFVLSFLFGLERQFAHKPIGFGTYIFVSAGSCVLALTAVFLNDDNPLPLISAVITSVGFLGAGALIKTTDKIFGFTSAASIWIFAILGMTVGLGEYLVASLLYGAIWIVVLVDKSFERRSLGSYQKKFTITSDFLLSKQEVLNLLGARKAKTLMISLDSANGEYTLSLLLEAPRVTMGTFPERLLTREGILRIRVD